MAPPGGRSRSCSSARTGPACGSRSMGGRERHLETYRSLGLRARCVGEEAVVDPMDFTLEGRSVRKLRQSVHRVERRGWQIAVCEGRDIDRGLEAEIDALEAAWRSERERLLGFAMSMGEYELGVRPRDLYALAWSPGGQLQAVMRFLAHRGKLSLDTMRRVGETPNGLNEALRLPRAGVRARSRRPRSEPQLRRARPPGQARAVRQPCRQGAHPVHAQPAAEAAFRWTAWSSSIRSSSPVGVLAT